MVITQVQFHNAMKEVNTAFAQKDEQIAALIARVEALEGAAKPAPKAKRGAASKAA